MFSLTVASSAALIPHGGSRGEGGCPYFKLNLPGHGKMETREKGREAICEST